MKNHITDFFNNLLDYPILLDEFIKKTLKPSIKLHPLIIVKKQNNIRIF